jgi:hypothetical protein
VHDDTQPAVIEIAPATRHVPAGTAATVRVTPRAIDGAPREGEVTLRVTAGPGTVSPPERDGATWVFTLAAPGGKGSSVIEASIDGTVISVRPRIWWDG